MEGAIFSCYFFIISRLIAALEAAALLFKVILEFLGSLEKYVIPIHETLTFGRVMSPADVGSPFVDSAQVVVAEIAAPTLYKEMPSLIEDISPDAFILELPHEALYLILGPWFGYIDGKALAAKGRASGTLMFCGLFHFLSLQ